MSRINHPNRRADNNIFGAAPAAQQDERSSVRLHHNPGGRQNHNIFGAPGGAAQQERPRSGRGRAASPVQSASRGGPGAVEEAPLPPAAVPAVPAAAAPRQGRRQLYPATKPFDQGTLRVSAVHTIYYEQVGNPQGKPAVVLHGGPGGGCAEFYGQFFDPSVYRVVLFDQRGAGRSTPHADLRENTTWDLVADIEALRAKLGIDRWVVFGGSWGSTLSLAYALTHPDRVKALILRGIFTLRASELKYFYQDGASHIYPEEFERYQSVIPPAERHDLIGAFHRRLSAPRGDARVEEERIRCARAWTRWEMATSRLSVDPAALAKGEEDKFALAFARIESHYFANAGFFRYDGELLARAGELRERRIPGVIVQGRFDVVCPATTAYQLFKNWTDGEGLVSLSVIPDAGHSCKEAGTLSDLVDATDRFSQL